MGFKELPIFIDKEGRWYYEGVEITHKGLYLYLNECLITEGEGKYLLRVDDNLYRIEVEDTPFVVKGIRYKDGELRVILNDGKEEVLDFGSLRIKENIPYCRVKGGRFPARFSRSSYIRLADYIVEDEGKYYICIGEKKHELSI